MRLMGTLALAAMSAGSLFAGEPLPMPQQAAPPPSSACAASAAASSWECPTCGHRGACPTCGSCDGRCSNGSRLWNWIFYRPVCRPDKECSKCVAPCHPGLYAWFPCHGGDGSCANGNCSGGSCASGRKIGSGLRIPAPCHHCRTRQCGEFRFADLCQGRFLYADDRCGNSCGAAHEAPAAAPATPPAAPVAPAPPANPMPPAESPPLQSISYKKDVTQETPAPLPPAPPKARRPTTYHPEAINPNMPVLSPDQFKKQPK